MSAMIKTENLSKDFGGGRGLHNLNMTVEPQRVFGYIGPNGSGKTTTIKLLCGLLSPSAGRAWVNGVEVLPKNHVQIKQVIGYLPDEFGVYPQMSVWEYLDFFGAAFKIPPKKRRERIDYVLDVTDAKHMIDYQVSSLSRGMHQKIGIAKTILHDPELLVLDEPANGLDPYARIEMRKTILRLKELGKTVVLSSHILPELGAICDEIGIIEKGQLLTQGTMRDITRRLQQDMMIELQVDSNIQEAAKYLGEIENIGNVNISGLEIRAEFRGKRNELADINAKLVSQGVRVLSLHETEADLEAVFLSVTGHKEDIGAARRRQEDDAKPDSAAPEATDSPQSPPANQG